MKRSQLIQVMVMIILISATTGIAYAANNSPLNSTNSSDGIIRHLDPTWLVSGYLTVNFDKSTAKVGDIINIEVTAYNTGLVSWCPLKITSPIPKGLKYVSHTVPDRMVQDYNSNSGIWDVYRMKYYDRGAMKKLIITTKVMPEAEGKKLTARAWFSTLVIEVDNELVFKSGIHMESKMSAARPDTLTIRGNSGSGNGNGTGNGDGNGKGNGTGSGSGNGTGYGNGTGIGSSLDDKIDALQSGGGGGKKAYELTNITSPAKETPFNWIYSLLVIMGFLLLISLGYFHKMRNEK